MKMLAVEMLSNSWDYKSFYGLYFPELLHFISASHKKFSLAPCLLAQFPIKERLFMGDF